MTTLKPLYVWQVYAPKSVDPAEGTILTPPPGAYHADPLVISTAVGGPGKPYLRIPKGRRGRVDPKTKEVDVGTMNIVATDFKVAADPLVRWISQFLGDDGGVDAIAQCNSRLYESLDGGASFRALYTGRIKTGKQVQGLEYSFSLKDRMDELQHDIFTGFPYQTPYAFKGALWPPALPGDWLSFKAGGFTPCSFVTTNGSLYQYKVPLGGAYQRHRCVINKELRDLAVKVDLTSTATIGVLQLQFNPGAIKVQFNTDQYYDLLNVAAQWDATSQKWLINNFYVQKSSPTQATPPGGTMYFGFYLPGDPTKGCALFINQVHPVTLLKDILSGKYGPKKADGTPQIVVPYDTQAFATLEADLSFGTVAFLITERAQCKDWLVKNICLPFGLAMLVNGEGQVTILDFRTYGGTGYSATITDDDLVSKLEDEGWSTVADDAISRMDVTYYANTQMPEADFSDNSEKFPDYPCAGIINTPQPVYDLDFRPRTLDFGVKAFPLDLRGLQSVGNNAGVWDFRVISGSFIGRAPERRAVKLAEALADPWRAGGRYLKLTCVRTTRTEQIVEGSRRTIQISTLPDPLTKVQGGARVGVCIERNEDQGQLTLVFLDLGAAAAAAPPTIDSLAQMPGNTLHGVEVGVTANAAVDPVVIQYNLTDSTVAIIPVEADTGWLPGAVVNGASTTTLVDLLNLPSNTKVWVRARSEPSRALRPGQPSVWVTHTPASVTTDSYAAPTSPYVDNVFGGTALGHFTPGDVTLATQVLVHVGPTYIAWGAADLVDVLDPGQATAGLTGLATGTLYTFGVRHVDPYGGVTAVATVDFTTGTVLPTAPRPAAITFLTPSHISLGLFPSDPAFNMVVGRAPDVSGSPGAETLLDEVVGTTEVYYDPQPVDGRIWWYRLYHTLPGYQLSSPTNWVSGVASLSGWGDKRITVLPTITDQKSIAGSTGTLSTTIVDPQLRVTQVRYKHRAGLAGTTTAYAVDTLPYADAVAILTNDVSTIWREVTYYGSDGVLVTVEQAFDFSNITGGVSAAVEVVLHSADTSAPAGRVLTDSASITWDWSVPGHVSGTVVGGGGGGGSGARGTWVFTTPIIARAGSLVGSVTLPSSLTALRVLSIDTGGVSCRLRVYSLIGARDRIGEAARAWLADPDLQGGLLADWKLATAIYTWPTLNCGPDGVTLANADTPAASTLYYRVDNYMDQPVPVTVTITYDNGSA